MPVGFDPNSMTRPPLATRQPELTLAGHPKEINDVHFSPDGRLLVSSSIDETFKVWDTETGQEVFTSSAMTSGFESPDNVVFSPDGRLLISFNGYSDGSSDMRVWDVARNWTLLAQYPDYTNAYFSPDARWLAQPGGEQWADILLWDLSKLSTADLASLNLLAVEPIVIPDAHNIVTWNFDFSPDSTQMATAGLDGTAKVWSLSPHGVELLVTLSGHSAELDDVHLSPDVTHLATASADGTVKVWDITSAGAADWFNISGHTDRILRFSLTSDGNILATASQDGTAKIWDT